MKGKRLLPLSFRKSLRQVVRSLAFHPRVFSGEHLSMAVFITSGVMLALLQTFLRSALKVRLTYSSFTNIRGKYKFSCSFHPPTRAYTKNFMNSLIIFLRAISRVISCKPKLSTIFLCGFLLK